MQRRLILMRHAKAATPTGPTDHARPLDARGREDAPRVAKELLARGWVPQEVLASDATRTSETWARMADALGAPPARFARGLYQVTTERFEEEVGLVDDGCGALLVVAHNPGLEEIVGWLASVEVQLATANAALLEGHGTTWARSLRRRGWRLVDVVRPQQAAGRGDGSSG